MQKTPSALRADPLISDGISPAGSKALRAPDFVTYCIRTYSKVGLAQSEDASSLGGLSYAQQTSSTSTCTARICISGHRCPSPASTCSCSPSRLTPDKEQCPSGERERQASGDALPIPRRANLLLGLRRSCQSLRESYLSKSTRPKLAPTPSKADTDIAKMTLCPGSKDDEPEDEFDTLPRSLRWRLKFAKQENDSRFGRAVVRLGNNRIVKRGPESTEYEALRVVDRHTSVPIPKVLGVYQLRDGVLVEYEIMPGKGLDIAWPTLSTAQRRKVIEDLGRFVDQLRKMQPPKHIVIGSATMGAAYDKRFGKGKIGPFYTLESFHDYVRRGHPPEDFTEQEIQQCHKRQTPYKLNFTHADLCPRNVLIDDSGRICSILGWEHAGWYPEYWEFTQMHHATPKEMGEWLEAMRKVVPVYNEELAADDALRKRYRGSIYDAPRSIRAPSPTPSELEGERKEIDDKNTDNTSG